MHTKIWIDSDQMGIECGVMNFGERNTVGDQRLAEQIVFVGDNVSGVEQQGLRKARKRTASIVGGDYGRLSSVNSIGKRCQTWPGRACNEETKRWPLKNAAFKGIRSNTGPASEGNALSS